MPSLRGYGSFGENSLPTSSLTETMQSLTETMQMPESKAFIDTNILLYLLSADTDKADRAEKIVQAQNKGVSPGKQKLIFDIVF
jgi:hypothetical protein